MILAGDIGGTNTRLALFEKVRGNLRLVMDREYISRNYVGLNEIVSAFLKETAEGSMRCSVYRHRPQICRDFDEKTCDDFVPLEEVGPLSPQG